MDSFPGGRVSAGDRNIEHTAIREMHEEVGGINADNVTVWGQLCQLPNKV
jgi:8-oxo-dGTP pyrophosphatase MutT (NUDIX family)